MINKIKVLSLLISFALIGCALEVDNPNSLLEDDLGDPSAAVGVANGALEYLFEMGLAIS